MYRVLLPGTWYAPYQLIPGMSVHCQSAMVRASSGRSLCVLQHVPFHEKRQQRRVLQYMSLELLFGLRERVQRVEKALERRERDQRRRRKIH
jgi:hypothetical protein